MLELQVLDLNAVVTGVTQLVRRLVGADIEIVVRTDPALGLIEADAGQLEQVIMNLTINARDAMDQGGLMTIETANVTLREDEPSLAPTVPPGPYVMLAVSDTGGGIDDETRSRIFEPFFTTKARGKGTGLGLATVYGIVTQISGTIAVESEVGKGTTFRVYLPRTMQDVVDEDSEPKGARPQGSETVLLVEDEVAVRELIRKSLERSGFHVIVAETPLAALDFVRQGNVFDLLVTDVRMPDMSGPVLAEQISRIRPGAKVLYISGYTDEAGLPETASTVAFLQKPFTPDALARKVRETLDARPERWEPSS
jgi:CheY-like chemotaxis protein